MDTLIKGSDQEWIDFLVDHIKKEDPEIVNEYDDDSLRKMVRVAINKSNRYGFTTANDQSAFVSIMFEIAPNFDDQPEIRAVLLEDKLPTSMRLEKLWSDAIPDDIWEQSRDRYDEAAWTPVQEDAA